MLKLLYFFSAAAHPLVPETVMGIVSLIITKSKFDFNLSKELPYSGQVNFQKKGSKKGTRREERTDGKVKKEDNLGHKDKTSLSYNYCTIILKNQQQMRLYIIYLILNISYMTYIIYYIYHILYII